MKCVVRIALAMFFLLISCAVKAQTLSGQLVDGSGISLSYANVVLLAQNDSSFIQGTVSDDGGRFQMQAIPNTSYLLKVSCIGYETVYKHCSAGDVGVLTIPEETLMLQEAVITARRPTYQMKNGNLVTNVQNSLLSKIGTADDVLGRIPGIQGKEGQYTVFGKGTPVIYINGRLVRDPSELDKLNSEDILNVEVLHNPGAQYDSTVKAVIRIKTVPQKGDGFGLNIRSTVGQSNLTKTTQQMNLNYRHNGLDVFAGMSYLLRNFQQKSHIMQTTMLDTVWKQNNTFDTDFHRYSYNGNVGLNYQFNEKHFAGVTYNADVTPGTKDDNRVKSEVYANGEFYDNWETNSRERTKKGPKHQISSYYSGEIGKWKLDFNADVLWTNNHTTNDAEEISQEFNDRVINTFSGNDSRLYAAKLAASYPLFKGNLLLGTELTHIRRTDYSKNEQDILPSSDAKIKENNKAAFVEYAYTLNKIYMSAGVRYEHVDFDYRRLDKDGGNSVKRYDDLFPTFMLSCPWGNVQSQLSYTIKTRRPSYDELSGDILYVNRFTYRGGNPMLQPETIQDLNLGLSYKWIQFSASYQHLSDPIINVSEQYPDNRRISLVTYRNFDKLKCLVTSVSLSPKISIWEPEFYVGVRKQWFEAPLGDGFKQMNRPVVMMNWNNAVNLPEGFIFRADMSFQTTGDMQNMRMNQSGEIDCSLYKSFLNDCLSFNLQWYDVGHLSRQSVVLYSGKAVVDQNLKMDSQCVYLTLRYKFNTSKSKYKGTGAGQNEINRL